MKAVLLKEDLSNEHLYRATWNNNISSTPIRDILEMFIEEEQFGSSIPFFKKNILDDRCGGTGNNQVGITKRDDGTIEMYDYVDDEGPSIIFTREQLFRLFDAIETTGKQLKECHKAGSLPQVVTYIFDDDWNWKVDIKQ